MEPVFKETEDKIYVSTSQLKNLGAVEAIAVLRELDKLGKEVVEKDTLPNTSPLAILSKIPDIEEDTFELLEIGWYDESIKAAFKSIKRLVEETRAILWEFSETAIVSKEAFRKNALDRFSLHTSSISMSGKGRGSVGATTARKIFIHAADYWRSGVMKPLHPRLKNYCRTIKISKDEVGIGCVTIKRYEAEAIAMHYGWMELDGIITDDPCEWSDC